MIDYREVKDYGEKELQELFESVNWLPAKYPKRLKKAIANSDFVVSAWDGNKLVGLINAIDDSELTAYAHYLLIDPNYQAMGIGKQLVERLKQHYDGYLYLLLNTEKPSLVKYYQKLGFKVSDGSNLMLIQFK